MINENDIRGNLEIEKVVERLWDICIVKII